MRPLLSRAHCADTGMVQSRGRASTGLGALVGGCAVLEDPSGMRVRWLRRAGRAVFVLFLAWLVAIVLGGLGLKPVPGIPLGHVMRASQGPPPLAKLPEPREPTASDLRPALPAAVFAAQVANASKPARQLRVRGRSPTAGAGVSHGKSPTAPGQTKTTPAVGSRGNSTTAPGQTKTTPAVGSRGNSTTAPGQTKTTPAVGSRGNSVTAPGQTKTTTSARRPNKP